MGPSIRRNRAEFPVKPTPGVLIYGFRGYWECAPAFLFPAGIDTGARALVQPDPSREIPLRDGREADRAFGLFPQISLERPAGLRLMARVCISESHLVRVEPLNGARLGTGRLNEDAEVPMNAMHDRSCPPPWDVMPRHGMPKRRAAPRR